MIRILSLLSCQHVGAIIVNSHMRDVKQRADELSMRFSQDVLDQQPDIANSSHCRLRNAYADSVSVGRKATIAIAGGSASAGAKVTHEETYAYQLSTSRVLTDSFRINNAAQGATSTLWSAMTMDSVVGNADLVIWEYAINDYGGGSTGAPAAGTLEMQNSLDLWIRKTQSLESRPAVLLLYLWDSGSDNFTSSAWLAQEAVARKFATAGVDMFVVQGGALARSLLQAGRNPLADKHHPSAITHQQIADMVELQMLKALLASGDCQANPVASVPIPAQVDADPILKTIWTTQSSALLPWRPQFGRPVIDAKIQLCPHDEGCELDAYMPEKWKDDRDDRKFFWTLPVCGDKQGTLNTSHLGYNATLAEHDGRQFSKSLDATVSFDESCSTPKLIVLSFSGGYYRSHGFHHPVDITLNREKVVIEKPPDLFLRREGMFSHFLVPMPPTTRKNKLQCDVLSMCNPDEQSIGDWGKGAGQLSTLVVFY
jgi:lysophospholipase L1-like esterase